MNAAEVRFCVRCGSELKPELRFGKLRPTCHQCGWIYFPDPKVAVAVLICQNDQVLLVRRVNEPYRGRWTLPAGFLDADEAPVAAVARECLEETGLKIRVTSLLEVIARQEHRRGAHLLLVYRGEILSGELRPGDDADQAGFFPLTALPPLAFESTAEIIQRFLESKDGRR